MPGSRCRSGIRAWLVAAERWLTPSAVAAAAGAVVAGVLEGRAMDTMLGLVAAAGFVALLAIPLLLGTAVIVRGLWAAWRPRELALVESDGSAPRLAGWIGAAVLGTLAIAWLVFQGTWLLVGWTTFKPLPVSYGVPAFAVAAALLAVAACRPVARALAAIARAIDRRWKRRGHRTLLSPWRLAIALCTASVLGAVLFWWLVVRVRLAGFGVELGFTVPALIGGVVAVIVHAAWPRLGRAQPIVTAVVAACALLAVACALAVWRVRPSLALAVWGDRPLAGFTVDQLFDLDAMRARLSRDELAPVAMPGAAHPDIVLVTLDSARADHTPPYGGNADMPTLADLGRHGAVFDWAFSPSGITRRSMPSMLVGLGPERVRGRIIGDALRVDPRHVLLAERLAAGGYETAGFVCCADVWDGALHAGLDRGLQHLEVERDSLVLAQHARAWLEARERRGDRAPVFVAIHLSAPHDWAPANHVEIPFDKRIKLYDRALARYDQALTLVLAAFSHRLDHPPIVIVTSDRGEALGDHGAWANAADLYDSQTRVPLVIDGPGIATVHVPETVSLVGLVPSIVELAGFAPPTGTSIDGASFAGLATGTRTGDPAGGVAFGALIRDRASPSSMADVVAGRWKLVAIGHSRELYDTRADPNEHTNAIATQRIIADKLDALLDQHRAHATRSPFE